IYCVQYAVFHTSRSQGLVTARYSRIRNSFVLQFLTRLFGSRNERLLRGYGRQVVKANALEPQIQALDDEALRAKTDEFRARLKPGETLDDLLPEAFAVAREAARRTLGMRHFDVQLLGGISLHDGKIS